MSCTDVEVGIQRYWMGFMPIVHDWSAKGLHTKYIGSISGDDLVEDALKVSGDPRFDDIRYVIGDWTESGSNTIGIDDVERLAACMKAVAKSNPYIKNATVMDADEERAALVGLYLFLTEDIPWEVDAFKTLEEAKFWVEA